MRRGGDLPSPWLLGMCGKDLDIPRHGLKILMLTGAASGEMGGLCWPFMGIGDWGVGEDLWRGMPLVAGLVLCVGRVVGVVRIGSRDDWSENQGLIG